MYVCTYECIYIYINLYVLYTVFIRYIYICIYVGLQVNSYIYIYQMYIRYIYIHYPRPFVSFYLSLLSFLRSFSVSWSFLHVTYPRPSEPSDHDNVVNVLGCLKFSTGMLLACCPRTRGGCTCAGTPSELIVSVNGISRNLSMQCRIERRCCDRAIISLPSGPPFRCKVCFRGRHCIDQTWSKFPSSRPSMEPLCNWRPTHVLTFSMEGWS